MLRRLLSALAIGASLLVVGPAWAQDSPEPAHDPGAEPAHAPAAAEPAHEGDPAHAADPAHAGEPAHEGDPAHAGDPAHEPAAAHDAHPQAAALAPVEGDEASDGDGPGMSPEDTAELEKASLD